MNETVLQARNLVASFEGQPLFSPLSFNLERGESFVLKGPNGIGKTTLLRAVAGLPGAILQGQWQLAKGIFPLFWSAQPPLYDELSVWDNLIFLCKVYNAPLEDNLGLVGLAGLAKKPAGLLSTGQKRRLLLASLMLIQPNFVLCDEPTLGLDKSGLALCLEFFTKLRKQGTAFLIATHEEILWNWSSKQEELKPYIAGARPHSLPPWVL